MADNQESPADDNRIVYTSADMMQVDTCSLVLSSRNIDHRIERKSDGTTSIIVRAEREEEAIRQLRIYFGENRNWPPPLIDSDFESLSSELPAFIVAAMLVVFYLITGPYQSGSDWFREGAADSSAILQLGEYFRVVTALCLHADFTHLAGNVLIGGFLIHFFLQISGTGIGLLLLLISASAANYVNAVIHGPGHISVGFSTVVFAIIGLLAAHRLVEHKRMFGIRMLVPFMAGMGLLAMLGSSGVRTDLGAHLFGLLAGFILGVSMTLLPIRKLRRSLFTQNFCLLVVIFSILTCWNMALAA